MKGQLRIDFEIGPKGRSVNVAGVVQTPRGPADVTQDVMFALGLLEYAKGLLWEKERAQSTLTGAGAIEVPVGVDASALRAR